MNLTTFQKLFISHFAAILLVSGSIGTYFYSSAHDSLLGSLRSRLKNSAALISNSFDVATLRSINGPADVDSPGYRDSVALARDFVASNPDIAFVYVMRRDGGNVYFVLDSDLDRPAKPGELYEEYIPELIQGFLRPSSDREIYGDKWGYFLSGYSPLEGGEGEYLLGIDMRADEVKAKFDSIRRAGWMSLAFSILLALGFSYVLARSFTNRIGRIAEQCRTLVDGQLDMGNELPRGDELDHLAVVFEKTSDKLRTQRRELGEHQESLQQARDDLEQRVDERTGELAAANRQLLAEIAERRRIERALEHASRTDYLTGLLNRRAMVERLAHPRGALPDTFCLAMIDIDHFKTINDRFGHAAGDSVLAEAARRLSASLGADDLLARWGGEEFLLYLPGAALGDALERASTMRESLSAKRVIVAGSETAITISVGVAECGGDRDVDRCLREADAALYRAKQDGRNCVRTSHRDTATDAQNQPA